MVPGLSFRQIEAFYWISRLGSFSAAAMRLNTSQPSISGRIRDLETVLGASLFDRSARKARLTPAGRNLVEVAERFVALGEELIERSNIDSEIGGVIRLGAADTAALTWLPGLVSNLSTQYPALAVELVVDLSLHLHEKLIEGEIDIAFMVGSAPGPDFQAVPIGEVRNAWMASPKLGFGNRLVSAEELAAFPVLTHSRGSHLHRSVQAWFESQGTRPQRLHGCSSLTTMIELTIAGLGVGVLPPILVKRAIADGQLMVIHTARPVKSNKFFAVFASRPPNKIARTIVEMAVRAARAHPAFKMSSSK
jgi:DNA-binding transcriptional LysR family regulator